MPFEPCRCLFSRPLMPWVAGFAGMGYENLALYTWNLATDTFPNISSPKENNHKDLGGEFVLLDESQKNVMQLLDQLGIGTEKVVHTIHSCMNVWKFQILTNPFRWNGQMWATSGYFWDPGHHALSPWTRGCRRSPWRSSLHLWRWGICCGECTRWVRDSKVIKFQTKWHCANLKQK